MKPCPVACSPESVTEVEINSPLVFSKPTLIFRLASKKYPRITLLLFEILGCFKFTSLLPYCVSLCTCNTACQMRPSVHYSVHLPSGPC